MKTYVLGNSSQEKGKQLEDLTAKILELLDYKKITKREISIGGHEIDLRAVKEQGIINTKKQIHLICECKAHVKSTNTTDWLKFLGKLYLEESKTNEEINACFISLYGVNGNVSGSYEDLRIKKSNIEIITGEDLFLLLNKLYKLIDLDALKININKYTRNSILNIFLVYHNKLYWLIEFSNDSFTILDSDGADIQNDNNLVEMVKDVAIGKFINVIEEKEKSDIIELYEKFILLILMEIDKDILKINLEERLIQYLQESDIIYNQIISPTF